MTEASAFPAARLARAIRSVVRPDSAALRPASLPKSECCAARKRFTRAPVSIETGQRV
jgi:hypothetical protein